MICALVFLAFLFSMGYLTFYANGNGNVQKILAPVYFDKNGEPQLCGEESGFTKNRYLYFTNLGPSNIKGLFSQGVCVDKCPSLLSGADGKSAATYDVEKIPCEDDKYAV